ncbi:MAG: hypothetical protein DMG44_17090 [Acidobacteria bacterium]|nr:MAG: hypothetical protein DMG44_17090 [Acidobacteriota bacterium]
MSRLLRQIMTLSICLILLSCACYPSAAGAYHKSGWQEDAKQMEANLAPTGAQGTTHEFEPTRPTQALAVNSNYTAVQRKFGRVSESIVLAPEPVSLALFGSGLTLAGLALLRRSRRSKWSKSARDAHFAVDRSYVRLARHADRVQSPVPDFRVPRPICHNLRAFGTQMNETSTHQLQ